MIIFNNAAAFSQVIAIIGDFENTPVRVDSVSMLVKNWNPDIVISSGDLFDPTDGNIDHQVGQYYAGFICPYHGMYGPGATSNEFYPALGNHDIISGGLITFQNFFTLPGNERYYSVHLNNIDFFILNSNAFEPDGVTDTSIQAQWLQGQLALTGNNWKIVIFHHAPYTSGPHPSTTYMQWLFATWGADAVISGHNHFYERLFVGGIPYFVNGAGGAILYSYSTLIPESQFLYNKLWGAMKILPYADSLVFSFYTIRDSLVDKYVIMKSQTSIEENFTIYPDVLNDNITICFSELMNEQLHIDIIDAEGKIIEKYENILPANNAYSLNIASLKSGIYFVSVKSENCSFYGKFVVL